ncbi:hypothetical protein IWW55_003520 [Coemansia sp. RSA 2706]|nr:hypothetical protein LPJ63_003778 [Coemansia sp. RSA 2711]KAJ2302216.1 hypothetical protein IWW55_003520 [Coemansia sp. RSA 2706]KAJ2306806.1 hypothetical protein IWW54_004620 [Coemansia sp. RSA 2705]KAJ2314216.1 hypothetical protein IWW52_004352 [Coemansia sp. RSA 2704]KAJ2324746.1 hypothetical protein IWW51_003127 [Coemansia sp. RSA 2702]KAJ2363617.1 hypothetical protein H4S01_004208 [Coemansia sp. RSA 2610]KAJ2724567.1 hypothetical protein H4R23_004247 [Coemansia sp. Cherry 401B]
MVSLHREENFVIIELGSHTTKAMQDVTDVNKLPTVHIRSRAGIAKPDEAPEPSNASQTDAEPKGSTMSVDGSTEAQSEPAQGADDAPKANSTDSSNDQDTNGPNYLFGSALASADADTIDSTVDIIANGFVNDWDALSAFLRHIMTKELGIRITDNTSALLFSIPALWPKSDLENLTQIAFEDLNAPTIMVIEQPLLAAYGNNGVTGIVIDMGHDTTTITPVIDSAVQNSSIAQTTAAGAAVTQRLQALLQADTETRKQFADERVPIEFTIALKESGLCKLQLPNADSADERLSFEFGEKPYTICSDALARAPEILVQPAQTSEQPLTTLIRQAVLGCDTDKRAALWENMHLVGGSSQFPGLRERLQFELESTVLPASNIFALSQTRDTRFCSLPEYFVGWRNHAHWAAFVGACLVAKIALTDSRHFVSRAEYNDNGPSVIHTKSF